MLSRLKQHRSPAAAVLIAAAMLAGIVLVDRRGHLEAPELNAYDFLLRRLPRDHRQSANVVLVGIDEVDIRAMGHYPICDLELAALLQRLIDHGAVAVGLDLARDVPVPCTQGDTGVSRLDAVLRNNPNIICAQVLGDLKDRTEAVDPPPALRDSPEQVGFADFRKDADGSMRRAFYAAGTGSQPENKVYSFAFRLAAWLLAQDDLQEPDVALERKLGMLTHRHGGYATADIRPRDNTQFIVDFRGGPSKAQTFQLRQALPDFLRLRPQDAPAALRPMTPADVKGKVVIVGVNAKHSAKDLFNTPLDNALFGIELHAHVVDQLLRLVRNDSRPVRSWPEWAEWLFALACSLAGGALAWWTRSAWKYAAGVLASLALIGLAAYLALRNDLWLPVIRPCAAFALPTLAVALYVRGLEHWQRKVIGNIFNRSVNTAIADELMRRGDEILAHGRLTPDERYVTILFTDLRGFTRLSEGMSPRRLIEWLDPYMEQMSTAVTDRGGMIVKYTGDGMMVVFGVPIYGQTESDYDEHALAAVNCALDMRTRFAQFVARNAPGLDPPLMMRVGIHSGPVVVGSVGNAQRLEFVTLGDTVNTASRLESMEKDMMHPQITGGGCRILIGESTFRRVQHHIDAQRVGEFTLAGKQQKIAVYGVVGPKTTERQPPRPLAAVAPLLLVALIALSTATAFAQDAKPAAAQDPQPAAQPQSQPASNLKTPKWGSQRKAPPPPGGQSIGGIARSEGEQTALFIFAPNSGGYTTRKLPVIYWLNTRPTDRPITFTLVNDKTDETLLKTTLSGKEAGLHMLDLAKLAQEQKKDVALETAQWSPGDPPAKLTPQYKIGVGVQLSAKDTDTADWTFAQSTIVRIPAPEGAQTPPFEQLVEAGVWFDAADALFRSLAAQPDNPALRSVLDEMIKSENVFQYRVPERLDTPEKEKERGRGPELLRQAPVPLELRNAK